MQTFSLKPLHHAVLSALVLGVLLAVGGVFSTSLLFNNGNVEQAKIQTAERDLQTARVQQAMRAMQVKKAKIDQHKRERLEALDASASGDNQPVQNPYPAITPTQSDRAASIQPAKPMLASAVVDAVPAGQTSISKAISKVAIIIDDMGHSPSHSDGALLLPRQVAFAILPYARSSRSLADKAVENGHEIIVHIPMQPKNSSRNPGPNVLKHGASDADLRRAIAWNLDQFDGFYAVNNHMGSAFTEDESAMAILFDELSKRGLAFYDSRTTAASKSVMLAQRYGLSMAERDVFLDNEREAKAVDEQLKLLETLAIRNGSAIAIGHPHKVTFKRIRDWSVSLADKGIVLVPPSEILAERKTPYWRSVIKTAGRDGFEAQSY